VSDFKLMAWDVVFEIDYPNKAFTVRRVVEVPEISVVRVTPIEPYVTVTAPDEIAAFGKGMTTMQRLGFTSAR